MIRCLIVDDEPIAIRVLQAHLEHVPDADVAATCTNAVEALRVVKERDIDLVFLDIEMPALTGIGFVEAMGRSPRFIFTTAHRDYAVRGFDLDAVDYLLKPISLPRLLRAVEKYRRLSLEPPEADARMPNTSISVRVDRRTVLINVRDIVYAESLSDYVILHTENDRHTTKMRLMDLAEELQGCGFARIHRSYVVALDRIDSYTTTEIRIGSTTLPVSRTYRRDILDRLAKKSW